VVILSLGKNVIGRLTFYYVPEWKWSRIVESCVTSCQKSRPNRPFEARLLYLSFWITN